MKKLICLAAIAALVAGGCTNKQGESEAPVFVTVNIALQPGFASVSAGGPIQIQTISLTNSFKNPSQSDPQGFAAVQINSYRVHFRRTDGGTVVPPDKTFGAGILLPSPPGSATLTNFPILSAADLQLSPFDQLIPFNGGIDRETRKDEIQVAWDITFFGVTVGGQRVQSTTASGQLTVRF